MHRQQETQDSCVQQGCVSPVSLCRPMSRSSRRCTRRPLNRLTGCGNVHQQQQQQQQQQQEQYSSPVSSSFTWSSSSGSSSNSTSLLSVLAWSMTLLLVSSCLGIADAGTIMGHPFSKRSFMDIQCRGVYDKSLFARLDRICEDCYNLFREPQLHTLCRKNCFTSDYFKGCLDVLLLQDEMEWIQTSIKQLHGADPGV